jgi:hypothetical protein
MMKRGSFRIEALPAAKGVLAELLFVVALGIVGCVSIAFAVWIAGGL